MKLRNALLLSAAVVVIGLIVSALAPIQAQNSPRARDARGRFMAEEKAVCVLASVGKSGVAGTLVFEKTGGKIRISGKITGLTPGKHGFHVHQFGDLSDSAKGESAGGHFNPHHMDHGAPDAHTRHTGDLGNVTADGEGVAQVDESDAMIQLSGEDSIIGRSIIVHEKADTFVQPTGGAGGRVAYGVIGWANPKTK